MTTASCPIPLHRPWLQRLFIDGWQRLLRRPTPAQTREEDAYSALAHLSDDTLRDIGAPDWLHERDRGLPLWTLERSRW